MVRLDILWVEAIECADRLDIGYEEIRGVKKTTLRVLAQVIRKMEMPFREVEKAAEDGSVEGKSVWVKIGDVYSSGELLGKVEI